MRHANYWFNASTGLPKQVDVAIIGGGIAGLSTLYHLVSSSSLDAVLLEESMLGYRASGRCIGQATFGNRPVRNETYGLSDEDADTYYKFLHYGNRRVTQVVRDKEISCGHTTNGGLHLATNQKEIDNLKAFNDRFPHLNGQWLSTDEVRSILPSKTFFGGLYLPSESTFEPYKLMRGLNESCKNFGQRVIVNAGVTAVEEFDDCFLVKIRNRGAIVARTIVYCTNAYTSTALVRESVSHGHSFVTNTLPNKQIKQLPNMNLVSHDYTVRQHNNRVLVSDIPRQVDTGLQDGEIDQSAKNRMHTFLYQSFPFIRASLDQVWSSLSMRTRDGLPLVGRIDDRMLLNIGFGETDFSLAFACGGVIRDTILHERSEAGEIFDPLRFAKNV